VNFVITMTVDGKNVDLVNYWYDKSMLAGDELIFRLEKKEVNTTFNLSSYYKQPQQTHVKTPQPCWQLVPDLLRQKAGADPDPCRAHNAWYHHRCQGYWRVAQTFQTRAENNINAFHRGMPLEVTFAPVWQSFSDCRDVSSYGKYSVEATVKHFTTTSHKRLTSVASKDRITFFYEREAAFEMLSSQNHYTIRYDKECCKVYQDQDLSNVLSNGAMIYKQKTPCLHVFFDENVQANTPQSYKPHANKAGNKSSKPQYKSFVVVSDTKQTFQCEIDELPTPPGTARVAEYLVTLTVNQGCDDMYDSDFLNCYEKSWNVTTRLLDGNFWSSHGAHRPDINANYMHLTDYFSVQVDYVPKATGSAALVSAPILRAFPERDADQPVRTGSLPGRPRPQMANLNPHTSLLSTGEAAADGMHVGDFSDLGGLSAIDPAGPKAPRRKKIKFLDPEPERGAGE
jgi:hypothetical protein